VSTSLAPGDFAFIAKLVKDEAGISLEPGKEYLVTSRVEPMARSLGYPDVASLVGHLRSSGDAARRRQVVESLTTHETSFFRDHEPFVSLQREIIPRLIEKLGADRKMTIWCGAASSGQESYSLCMLLREYFPELANWNVTFLSTDISRPILERCKTGVYNQIEVNRGLPAKMLTKYFDKVGSNWVIKPEIRSAVKFTEMNLLRPFGGLTGCDLVLLRNVLIYFDISIRREILEKTARVMAPHGYLLLGTAETTLNITDVFDRVVCGKTSCYRPKARGGS
jgi:chemotaxis protein methyltransferase CheR